MDLAWLKRFRHKGAAHAPEAFELHTFDATKSPPDCRVGAGPEDVDAYFVDGHPPVTESCRDDVAAYEFDGALRVFYAFRPAYAAAFGRDAYLRRLVKEGCSPNASRPAGSEKGDFF